MRERLTGADARARIIAATATLIEERGTTGVSVTIIMERAGISRTAFYRHFDDPYAVMRVLLERIGAEVLGRSGGWLNDPRSVGSPDVVYPNLLSYARAYAPYGRLLAALVDAAGVDAQIHALWRDHILQGFIDATRAAIERDQAAGAIRPDLDARATSYALSLMGERASYDFLGASAGESPRTVHGCSLRFGWRRSSAPCRRRRPAPGRIPTADDTPYGHVPWADNGPDGPRPPDGLSPDS